MYNFTLDILRKGIVLFKWNFKYIAHKRTEELWDYKKRKTGSIQIDCVTAMIDRMKDEDRKRKKIKREPQHKTKMFIKRK